MKHCSQAPKPNMLEKSFTSRRSCNSFATDSLSHVQVHTEVETNFSEGHQPLKWPLEAAMETKTKKS